VVTVVVGLVVVVVVGEVVGVVVGVVVVGEVVGRAVEGVVGMGDRLTRAMTVVWPSLTCISWPQTSNPSSRSSTDCIPAGTFSMIRGPCARVFPA